MDRTTKLLLAAIALGLWANALPKAEAQSSFEVHKIAESILSIATGTCKNKKLC